MRTKVRWQKIKPALALLHHGLWIYHGADRSGIVQRMKRLGRQENYEARWGREYLGEFATVRAAKAAVERAAQK